MPLDLNSGRRRPPRPRPPLLARTPARSLALHAPGVKNHSTVHLPPSTLLPWTDTTDKHALESVATAAAIGLVPRSSTLDFFHQLQLSYPILPTDRTDRTYLPTVPLPTVPTLPIPPKLDRHTPHPSTTKPTPTTHIRLHAFAVPCIYPYTAIQHGILIAARGNASATSACMGRPERSIRQPFDVPWVPNA